MPGTPAKLGVRAYSRAMEALLLHLPADVDGAVELRPKGGQLVVTLSTPSRVTQVSAPLHPDFRWRNPGVEISVSIARRHLEAVQGDLVGLVEVGDGYAELQLDGRPPAFQRQERSKVEPNGWWVNGQHHALVVELDAVSVRRVVLRRHRRREALYLRHKRQYLSAGPHPLSEFWERIGAHQTTESQRFEDAVGVLREDLALALDLRDPTLHMASPGRRCRHSWILRGTRNGLPVSHAFPTWADGGLQKVEPTRPKPRRTSKRLRSSLRGWT